MKQKAKRILVVMLTVMIIFGYFAPLVADEANAATADLDLCDLGCELEHCDGDHCDGGHYDEENCDWGHCDEEICDGVICDGDNCDGGCYSEHCGDCECENGHCDEQCDSIGVVEVSSSSSVGRRAKAEAVCNHVWKTEVSKQPGCTTAGVYVTRCIKCRAYAQNGNGYITPLGHKWKRIVTKQPTCTMPGTYVNKCERCNMSTTGTISALGHALSWKYKTAPTETMPGVEEYSCNICGYVANVRYIPPLGNGSTSTSVGRNATVQDYCSHNYVLTVIKAATCTADGKKAYKCTKCQAQQYGAPTFTIPKLGHDYRQYTTKQPTCTAQGTYVTKCSRCGAGSQNGNGYIGALGHKWNAGSVTKSATCTATGTKTFTCTRCSGTKTESIAALGHSAGAAATCTTPQKCTRCSATLKNALGHAWDNGTVTKAATCTATGTKVYKCTRSGCSATTSETIPMIAHNCEWRVTVQPSCKGSGTEQYTCKVCGTGTAWRSIQYYGDHTWVAATCTKAKTCSVCGTTSGNPLGHAYSWRTTVNPTCTTVGKKEQYCTRPGCTSVVNRQDVAALNHAWDNGTVTKAATHSATGVKTFKCTRSGCGATKTETIPVIAHSYTWVVTTPSTCTKEGVESYKCSCGYVSQTRPVAKKAHNGVWATTVQPSCAGSGTEECTCKDCGAWLGARSIQYYGDHTWNRAAADCTHDKKCTVCGYVAQKATGHVYTSEATCTEDKKCNVCGYVAKKALGHDYQTETTKQPTCTEQGVYVSKCTRCGNIAKDGNGYIGATGHKWKDNLEHADCERAKECTVCGFVAEEATGHKWNALDSSATSSQVGGEFGKSVGNGHVLGAVSEELFSEDQFVCEYCRKQANVTEIQVLCKHDWVLEKTVDATCKSAGHKIYRCCRENCRDIIVKGIRPKKHLGKWEIVTPPTVNKIGTEGYRCDSCGDIVEERECYLVTYDANGGTDAPDSQIKYYDQFLVITAGVPKRQGYKFRGWGESPDATSAVLIPKATYYANANLKLYAIWEINTYTITLKAIGATNIPSSLMKNYDEDLVLPTPVRSRYIFKGWSDAANGTVKWAPGAKYTENADMTLYAVWEQYYVSAKTEEISIGAKGNKEGEPVKVKLSSNCGNKYYAWVQETSGGLDWIEVQTVGDTLVIRVDTNPFGTTRTAIVSITNESEAAGCVRVTQERGYVRLIDSLGYTLSNDGSQNILFDENGKYKNGANARFYVSTPTGEFTCSVEYGPGVEEFLEVSASENYFTLICRPNISSARTATLVVRYRETVQRYPVVQQAKSLTIVYKQYVNGTVESEPVRLSFGEAPSREHAESIGFTIPQSVCVLGVEIPLVGWITTDGEIVPLGQGIYESTSCFAFYSAVVVADAHRDTNLLPSHNITFDWKGLKKQEPVFVNPGTEIMSSYGVYSISFPWFSYLEEGTVEVQDANLTFINDKGCIAYSKEEEKIGNAHIWVYDLTISSRDGENITARDIDGNVKTVFAPYEEAKSYSVVMRNNHGAKTTVYITQQPPKIEKKGWTVLMKNYGISESVYYNPACFWSNTSHAGIKIVLEHNITRTDEGFINQTSFVLRYDGTTSLHVASGKEEYLIVTRQQACEIVKSFRVIHDTLVQLREDSSGIDGAISKIKQLKKEHPNSQIVCYWGEKGLDATLAIAEGWKWLSERKIVKGVSRLVAVITLGELTHDALEDLIYKGLDENIETVTIYRDSAYDVYGLSPYGQITNFNGVDEGFFVKLVDGKKVEIGKSSGLTLTFNKDQYYDIDVIEDVWSDAYLRSFLNFNN